MTTLQRPLRAHARALVFVGCVVGALAGLPACPQAPVLPAGTCKSDLDCGTSESCNVPRGQCICIDDNACDATEFCNAAGGCQQKLECLNNNDCRDDGNPSAICDTTTGACLTLSASVQCVLDSQCPYGSFCDSNECTPGCQDNGDCQLGDPCINGQCDPTPGACNQNSFCEFGQICGADNRCRDHALRDQLCSTCNPNDFGGGSFCLDDSDCDVGETCDTDILSCVGGAGGGCGQDDCLIDSSVEPTVCSTDNDCARGTCEIDAGNPGRKICQGFFCGAFGCDDVTNPCPRGYSCFTLQLVPGGQCDLGDPSSCQAPRACNGGGENGNVGFCSCAQDSDCPFGSGATCVNPGPFGSCVIGTTCGPSDGLLCEDLR